MRPTVPRFVRWTVALAVIAALVVAVFQYWGSAQYGAAGAPQSGYRAILNRGLSQAVPPGPNDAADPGGQATPNPAANPATKQPPSLASNGNWTPTPWGPLGPADRDLLVRVRQTGLTESLTGQQAQRQAASSQVRAIAKRIWVENAELDSSLRWVAGTLGLALPNQPSTQQQGWMRRLAGLSGPSYDRMFAQQLRLTHGELLPLITSVRAGTRNELVRSLAASAATVISRHMEYLERTGLVDYSRLPQPLVPPAAPPAAARPPSAAARPPATASRAAAPPPGPPATPVTGAPQQIDQVVNTTQVPPAGNDVKAMLAALVSVAALLIALGLLGTGRRVRRAEAAAQHRSGAHRRRHAAQRW